MALPRALTSDVSYFPPAEAATEDGLVAIGGDLQPERLLIAYSSGIFPWPHEGYPLLWFSPDPRMILEFPNLHVSHSLRKTMRKGKFKVTADRAFRDVIRACASTPRPGQDGTWINEQIIEAYSVLHYHGFAHSVETWMGDELVGGLYGVSLGGLFCGESMFSRERDASKVAFVTLARKLEAWGFDFIDCQVYTPHLASLGAREWPRSKYLEAMDEAVGRPIPTCHWSFEEDCCLDDHREAG